MTRIKTLSLILTTASLTISTPAAATPGSGFVPNPIVNGNFGTLSVNTAGDKTGKWGLIMKSLDDTDIGADRLAIQPGGVMRSFSLPACSSFAAGVVVSLCGVALIVAATGFRRWSGTEVAAPADPPAPRVEPHHPPAQRSVRTGRESER